MWLNVCSTLYRFKQMHRKHLSMSKQGLFTKNSYTESNKNWHTTKTFASTTDAAPTKSTESAVDATKLVDDDKDTRNVRMTTAKNETSTKRQNAKKFFGVKRPNKKTKAEWNIAPPAPVTRTRANMAYSEASSTSSPKNHRSRFVSPSLYFLHRVYRRSEI